MKKTIIIAQLLLITAFVNAQQVKESLQKEIVETSKEKFSGEKLFHFEYTQGGSRDFDSELFDQKYQDAKIKNQEKFSASVSIPIYKKNRWEIVASGSYQFNRFEFEDISNDLSPIYFERNGTADFHYLATEISIHRFSQLFNKPIMYMGSIKGDGYEKDFGRIKANLGFNILLMNNERTTLGIGAMAFSDPSELFPCIPLFVFNHKFRNSKWELDMLLPDKIQFQRAIGQNGRLSVGSYLENTGFYIENKGPGKDLLEYTQLELKTGFKYEHRINHFLIASLQAGVQNFLDSKLLEKGESSSNDIYNNSQDMTGYIQVGISITPFGK